MSAKIDRHRRRGRLGDGARQRGGRRRARRRPLDARSRPGGRARGGAREPARPPGRRGPRRVRPTADPADLAAAAGVLLVTPAQTTRAVAGAGGRSAGRDAPGALRQGPGARLEPLPQRRRPRRSGPARRSRPCRARASRATSRAGCPTAVTLACADQALAARLAHLSLGPGPPGLPPHRPARRRDRRRRQERAGDRVRRRGGPRPRRERQGGARRPRLCRAPALRGRVWRRAPTP